MKNNNVKKVLAVGSLGIAAAVTTTNAPIISGVFADEDTEDVEEIEERSLVNVTASDIVVSSSIVNEQGIKAKYAKYNNTLFGNGEDLFIRIDAITCHKDVEISVSYNLSGEASKLLKVITGDNGSKLFKINNGAVDISKVFINVAAGEETVEIPITKIAPIFASVSNVSVDTVAPTLSYYGSTANKVNGYITSNGELQFNVLDTMDEEGNEVETSGISSVKAFLADTGKEVPSSYDADTDLLSVRVNQFANGSYTLNIEAEDNLGNTNTLVYTFDVLRNAPAIEGVSHSSVNIYGNKTYANHDLELYLESKEVNKFNYIKLYKDDKFYCDFVDGVASIATSGTYTVLVEDIAGNRQVYLLSDLFRDLCEDVVIDSSKPVISGTVNDSSVTANWEAINGKVKIVIAEDKIINEYSVSVNGEVVAAQSQPTKEGNIEVLIDLVELDKPSNGVYNVIVDCTDVAGNSAMRYKARILLDYDSPDLSEITVSGEYTDRRDEIYSQGNITIGGTASDLTSGVNKVEVLKDGVVCATELPYTINESGKYTVVVTDNAGIQSTITLAELLGSKVESNLLVVDKSAPELSVNLNGEEFTDDWVANNAILNVSAKDNTHIKEVVISVNGKEEIINDGETSTGNSILFPYDLSKAQRAQNGIYNISIYAKDWAGNVSENFTATVKADFDAPVLEGLRVTGNYTEKEGVVYVNDSVSILGTSADVGSGTKLVELLKDGTVVATNNNLNVNQDGEYKIKLTDVAGLVSEFNLSELLGTTSSRVVVDSTKPTVSATLNNKEIESSWVTGEGVLTVNMEDNICLKSVEINVNGRVYNYILSGSNDSVSIDLKTDVPRSSNGQYNISVVCKDIVGNESDNYQVRVLADFDKPILSDISVTGSYVEDEGRVYLEGNLTVNARTKDIGSGVKSVELYNGNTVVSNKLPFIIDKDGEYTIKLVDNAGLEQTYSLNELIGTSSNVILADNDIPSITRRTGYEPNLVINDVNWYKICPTLSLNISDMYLKNVSIKVNGDEKVSGLSNNNIYTISTEGYEGDVTVEVEATDYFGHVSKDTFSYKVDINMPVIKDASIVEKYTSRGDSVFFKSEPTLTVTAEDTGVGLESVFLGGSSEGANVSGVFKLKGGEYTIEVKDKLGNSTGVKSVAELVGIPSNKIIVDSENPEIKATRPSGSYNSWYANNIKYPINLLDNQGIKSATVKINNKVVEEYESPDITTTSATVYADTSKVQPNDKGMYQISVEVVDNAGNAASWSDTIYIDSTAPTVDKFVFTGNGVQEGAEIDGSNKYGFYFSGSATVDIHVSDGEVSSGMDKLFVTLKKELGGSTQQEVDVSKGVATIKIPDDFRGTISAYATDKVGNKGKSSQPDGVITQGSNTYINSVGIDIKLPETSSIDTGGNPLYKSDMKATAEVKSDFSGIRSIEWGIDTTSYGTVTVDNKGIVSGDVSDIKQSGGNLVVSLDKVLDLQGNSNGLNVWVKLVDKTGNTSEKSRKFSIDKDVPEINVTFDNNSPSGYYNTSRTASIVVKERNFDPNKFIVSGSSGILGSWTNKGEEWHNTISFNEDNKYLFALNCTDMAGNVATAYTSEEFTIDKTAPVLSVAWDDGGTLSVSEFFNRRRTALITVVDRNFDPSLYVLQGNGSLGAWSGSGDVHTTSITFDNDGEYEFTLSGADLAGNQSNVYSSGKFIIDTVAPILEINGVQDGVSYKDSVSVSVKVADKYLNPDATTVTLVGKKNGLLRITGTLDTQTGEFIFPDFPKEESYDDIYTLTAVAADKAGNVVNSSLMFSVNRFGSSYDFVEAGMLNSYLNKPKAVSIVETNVDKLDVSKAKVAVMLGGKEIDVDKDLISIKEEDGVNGKFSYTYTVDKEVFSEDGKYLIQVYSKALEGTEYSSVAEEYAFVLDRVNPEIIISGVKDNEQYRDYDKNVTIDVRDVSGIKDMHVYLNGKEVQINKSNGVYSIDVRESSRKQSIRVEVTDLAGNGSTKEVSDFVITSDVWSFILNQLWFKLGVGAVGLFLGVLIALFVKNRRDSAKEEEEMLNQNAELYKASNTSSGANTSSGEKDEVEDLDK